MHPAERAVREWAGSAAPPGGRWCARRDHWRPPTAPARRPWRSWSRRADTSREPVADGVPSGHPDVARSRVALSSELRRDKLGSPWFGSLTAAHFLIRRACDERARARGTRAARDVGAGRTAGHIAVIDRAGRSTARARDAAARDPAALNPRAERATAHGHAGTHARADVDPSPAAAADTTGTALSGHAIARI
jgi:hypothetical protein